MIFALWILNFIISWLNAWSVGKTWNETKAAGGPLHFMSWMGATMSAVGFTWCYVVIVCLFAPMITWDVDGVATPILSQDQALAVFDLAYLIYIFPLIGSGMAIMTHSWGVFWRRRSFENGVTVGWNTYAQISNFYSAVEHVPSALGRVGDLFSGGGSSSSSSDSDSGKGVILIVALVALCVCGGIFTTYTILRRTASSTASSRRAMYEMR